MSAEQVHSNQVYGQRIRQARQARGLGVSELAELMDVSRTAIRNWEVEEHRVNPELVPRLSRVLGQPDAYFYRRPEIAEGKSDMVHFRSRRLKEQDLGRLQARFAWLVEYLTFVNQHVKLPDLRLPPAAGADTFDEIEDAAADVRRAWGLGPGPLLELTRTAELNGVFTQAFHFGVEKLDGFSYWHDDLQRPFIWLNLDKGKYARSRFDLAHEIGHMVLHRGIARPQTDEEAFQTFEQQAHRFASALLMPRENWLADIAPLSGNLTLSAFKALKPKWRTSIAAMIYRTRELGFIGAEDSTRLWKQYASRKWKVMEPFDETWPIERPTLIREATRVMIPGGNYSTTLQQYFPLSPRHLAELSGLTKEELEAIPATQLVRRAAHAPVN